MLAAKNPNRFFLKPYQIHMAPKPNSAWKILKSKQSQPISKKPTNSKTQPILWKTQPFSHGTQTQLVLKKFEYKKANQLAKTQPISKPNRFFQKPNLFQINWLGF